MLDIKNSTQAIATMDSIADHAVRVFRELEDAGVDTTLAAVTGRIMETLKASDPDGMTDLRFHLLKTAE